MLGGTIRGKRVTLRMPVEADLPAYMRWAADMRARRAHPVWHEPAAAATGKERLDEQSKDSKTVLWTIEAGGRVAELLLARIENPDGEAPHELWSVDLIVRGSTGPAPR